MCAIHWNCNKFNYSDSEFLEGPLSKNNTSTLFTAQPLNTDEEKVAIVGDLDTFVRDKRASARRTVFIEGFKYLNGRFCVREFKDFLSEIFTAFYTLTEAAVARNNLNPLRNNKLCIARKKIYASENFTPGELRPTHTYRKQLFASRYIHGSFFAYIYLSRLARL